MLPWIPNTFFLFASVLTHFSITYPKNIADFHCDQLFQPIQYQLNLNKCMFKFLFLVLIKILGHSYVAMAILVKTSNF